MNRYSEYKDSGVEWIGEIPSHWKVKPLFTIFCENKQKNKEGNLDVLTLSYGKIKKRDLSKFDGLFPENFYGYQIVRPNFIIIRSTDLQNDHKSLRVGYAGMPGVITSAYLGLMPISDFDTKYFYYLIHLSDLKKVLYGLGAGLRQSLRFDDFKRFPVLVFSHKEQTLISEYLDKKTSQIDSLIEKISRKIELLKEKRTSLINQCVTKGLDPDVEMKYSGVEWIGEIPGHWKMKKIKHIGTSKSGDGFPIKLQNDATGTIPFFKVSDTNLCGNETYLNSSNNYVTESTIKEMRFKVFEANSIVFPKIGEVLRKNKRRILSRPGCIDNNMMALEVKTADLSKFLYYLLCRIDFSFYCSDGTVPSIGETQVGDIKIPIPPEKEQALISKHLGKKTSQIDSLIEKETRRIELLKEYRQSLISNVVTGKVRITEEMI